MTPTTRHNRAFLSALFAILCAMLSLSSVTTAKTVISNPKTGTGSVTASDRPDGTSSQGQTKDIVRRGDLITISRQFVDEVSKDNGIVLSKVAIKVRVDANGKLAGYQLVQIDRGSAVERMGFKPRDILIGVNGIPARELESRRPSLETADRLDLTVLRGGKEKKMRVEIK
jgi:type II secretory pathway component PulC